MYNILYEVFLYMYWIRSVCQKWSLSMYSSISTNFQQVSELFQHDSKTISTWFFCSTVTSYRIPHFDFSCTITTLHRGQNWCCTKTGVAEILIGAWWRFNHTACNTIVKFFITCTMSLNQDVGLTKSTVCIACIYLTCILFTFIFMIHRQSNKIWISSPTKHHVCSLFNP